MPAICCGCSGWTAPPPSRRTLRLRKPIRPGIDGLLEGGVPIVKDGQVIGAVGVSGVKSNEDAQIARAGIAALGL